jgi:hypothetical protein
MDVTYRFTCNYSREAGGNGWGCRFSLYNKST